MAAKPKTMTTATGLYVNGRCIECKTFKSKPHKDGCKYGRPIEEFTTCVQCQGVDGNHDLTCSLHPDHVRETPVNGETSKVVHTKTPAQPELQVPLSVDPIELLDGAWQEFQRRINVGELKGTKKPCEFEYAIDGAKKLCGDVTGNIGAFEQKVRVECEYGTHNRHVISLCIGHAVNVHGGNAHAVLQTKLDL